ncbi:retinol dehydrogenase 12-like [Pararge aegeria]|uniref:retinol dehydrogenase 12-like n=1 Tax=Pararge aegeria TaxID=116150 RepID=UPI0019D13300|nr:retinol dehydrogenase 12-like [Pararge aegeria]
MLVCILIAVILFLIFLRLYLKSCVRKCKCNTSLVGKVVIVTGANSGIGYHTAFKLAAKGSKVILACRNENRARIAIDKIKNGTGNSQVTFKKLDLTSLQSIRDFADNVLKTEDRLDVLVNNAGACALENKYTTDGIIEGMQVNHFGPFLLTLLLIPLLKKSGPSRIINVSSLVYLIGFVNLKKINEKRALRATLYADSKLCNLLIQQEFARRLKEMDIVINSVHPGIIMTNILGEMNPFFEAFLTFLCWMSPRTTDDGAETVVHVALSEECGNATGKFYIDCKDTFVLYKARNPDLAQKLWEVSENVVKDYL